MATPKAGGFKLSLAGAKSKPGFKATLVKPAKRARLDLGDDEPEEDNKKQEISGWDAAEGGAVELNGKKEEKKGPWIIPALPNRDWRVEAMKKQKLARAGAQPGQNGGVPEYTEGPKMAYGLTTFKKENHGSASPEPMDTAEDSKPQDDGLTEEQRLEKRALDALINGKSADQTVIPLQSEEDAFLRDFRDAPEAPIEGFGAALLRGMGWKGDDEAGSDKKAAKPKEIKRRPALLGIGAKPESAVGIELGEWGKDKKKVAMSYNPVTLRNKHTGEKISEEELNARLEAQKLVQEEKPSRSSKYNDEDEDRRHEKRKEKKDRDRRDDDYDSERTRNKDRRSDRRRDNDDEYSDRERRREKKYREDDYDDSDRRREKKRDKDRRDDSRSRDDYDRRDKGRDRDRRHRSRSPDNEDRREKRRERDRRERDGSRSRDSDDHRKRRRDYDDDREERKRRHTDDKKYRK
jgi:hypothetical protein